MALLWPIIVLGTFINVAVFLVVWNFRGRGFGELIPWRRASAAASNPSPDRVEGPAGR